MKNYLTEEGFEKIKKELKSLETIKRKEVSEKLKEAAAQGDLSENASYEAAKDEQAFLEAKIKELKKIIANSEIIKKERKNIVSIGSTVHLKSDEGEEIYQIVGPEEANINNNKISFKSPLGSLLLNKKEKDVVRVNNSVKSFNYKITKIE